MFFEFECGKICCNLGDNTECYPFAFNDKYNFVGGTGQFEGVSGYFMTNAFIHADDEEGSVQQTDFFSEWFMNLPFKKK